MAIMSSMKSVSIIMSIMKWRINNRINNENVSKIMKIIININNVNNNINNQIISIMAWRINNESVIMAGVSKWQYHQ
jgi:hypothetical protein